MSLELTLIVFQYPRFPHKSGIKERILSDDDNNLDSSAVPNPLIGKIGAHLFPWTWEAQNAKL